MNPGIHFYADEGQFVELGCLGCKEDVVTKLVIASPVRYYVAALQCPGCMEELVAFDVLSQTVADFPLSEAEKIEDWLFAYRVFCD